MSLPVSHAEEALKLQADAVGQLYEVRLRKTQSSIFFWNHETLTWQGSTYVFWPCQQDKDRETADDETPRPTLTIYNPLGALMPLIDAGEFDLATVIRRDVHQADIYADRNIFQQRVWFIGRALQVNRKIASFELRGATDIPEFQIPPRSFSPSEGFPFVNY